MAEDEVKTAGEPSEAPPVKKKVKAKWWPSIGKVKLTPGIDPETGEKVRPRRRRKTSRFETDSERSQMMRARYQDPEYRRNMELKVWIPRKFGVGSRKNVFDGRSKAESQAIWAAAKEKATETMAALKEHNLLNLPKDDADRAEAAMELCLEVMFSEASTVQRLDAAKTVLKFTKAPPATKANVTIQSAEAWLASVLADGTKETQAS